MAVTDNFNRADGGLGANWATGSGFGALSIVSNTCKGSGSGVHNVGFYTAGGTIPADQYAQCKVTATGSYMGTVLRSDGVSTFYVCFYQPSAGNATIYKVVSGSFISVATGSVMTPTVNDVIYFEVVGNILTFKINGVVVATGSDSTITGAGYTGIDIFETTGVVDDFEGGSTAADVSVSLTGVAATPAIGTGAIGIVGGFNPATISGLVVWLKADSLLVSDGGPVSPWFDMSGNANDGIVTASPPPTIRAGALNGLGVVRFSYQQGRIRGDTDLALSGLPAPGYNYSILYIGRMVGPNVGRIFAGTFPATNFLVGYHTSSVDVAYDGNFIGPVVGYPVGTPTRWKQYSYTASHDGTTYDSDFYISGATIGGLATGNGLQSRYNLSGYDATGDQETCDCEVAELLIYNHKLTDADRILVEQYLNDKWFNVVLTGVAADPQVGVGTIEITAGIAPPSAGGGTGAGRPARTGMRLRPTEDKAVYLKGVAANPQVGQVMLLSEMRGVYEKYVAPIRRVEAQKTPKMPAGMRGLFKPVEKPIPPAVFVYQVGLPKLKSAVGTGKVNAFYEEIDEELVGLLDVL